jgi:hypothetical protein
MSKAVELLRQGRDKELWQMCCGFLSLSLEQFMAIQERLLLEQIELLSHCTLGRKVSWIMAVRQSIHAIMIRLLAKVHPKALSILGSRGTSIT